MFDDYLRASVGQLLLRARNLNGEISKPNAPEYYALWQRCSDLLNIVVRGLDALLKDERYLTPLVAPERLRAYKRLVGDLDFLESVAFAAIKRQNDEDLRMTKLVGEIAEEIRFMLPPPVVSCQSQSYFHAYPLYNLLLVPQKEVEFLLHLPDLYHELGHFVLLADNNPAVEAFQKAHEKTLADALGHTYAVRRKPTRGPRGDAATTRFWEDCWVRTWAIEFFCDLFGVCAAGPSYGWAHLHLCMKRGGDPFQIYSSHPPDEARMFVVLEALTSLDYAEDAGRIDDRWRKMLELGAYTGNPDYDRCFPRSLLRAIAINGVNGYKRMGCRSAQDQRGKRVNKALNEAWRCFWGSPATFADWERATVADLIPANRGCRREPISGPTSEDTRLEVASI